MKKLMITMMLFAATRLCGNVANAQCQKKADCQKECVKKADCQKDCEKLLQLLHQFSLLSYFKISPKMLY